MPRPKGVKNGERTSAVTVNELMSCYLEHPGEFHKFTPPDRNSLRIVNGAPPDIFVSCDVCEKRHHCGKRYSTDHLCRKGKAFAYLTQRGATQCE
jgi:hypothetical protein